MKQKFLNYGVKGEGEPLLLLHGLFASGKNWLSTVSHFSKSFKVYTPDLRNHGDSFHSEEMNYELMANDIKDFCNELNLSSISIIGHSMGGKTAMVLALNHPDLIKSLIISDIAPVTYKRTFETVFKALFELPLEEIRSLEMAKNILNEKIPDPKLISFLLTNLKRDKEGGFNWRINLEGIQNGMEYIRSFPTIEIPPYLKPVLFLKGETSHHIAEKHSTARLKYFPNSQVLTIKNAGHNIHTDNKESFIKTCSEFLVSF